MSTNSGELQGLNISNKSNIDTDKLKTLSKQIINYSSNMSGYARDFMQALQNQYQSELFGGYKIPKRQPQDENIEVLPTPD